MRYIIAGVIGALLFVAVIGGANDSGANYAAERTAQVQAQQAAQTERTAIIEAQRTERTAISADVLRWQAVQEAQTQRMIVLILGVIVGGMGCTVAAVAAIRYIGSAPQRQDTAMLAYPSPQAQLAQVHKPTYVDTYEALLPGHTAEYNEHLGDWILVDERGRYYTVSDAQRIVERRMIAQRHG